MGCAQEFNNNKPISITSILEKNIFKHIHKYLIENKINYNYLSGFQPWDSTTNQLVENHVFVLYLILHYLHFSVSLAVITLRLDFMLNIPINSNDV